MRSRSWTTFKSRLARGCASICRCRSASSPRRSRSPRRSPLIETDSSQRGQVITGDQTRALPLISREYSALALLTTGVKLGGSSLTTGNTPREGAFNVNGLRSTFNNFLIDGVDNNAYGTSNQGFSNQVMQPPPDAIGEFKVVTNNMSAEYGRAAGATINVNYRSGTNQLHGSGWEFLRETSPERRRLLHSRPTGKPSLDRNQFGGVIGGPIVRNRRSSSATTRACGRRRKAAGFRDHRDAAAAPGHPVGRRPRSAIGRVYPAGTPIPMTAFAREVLSALPDTNLQAATNNYTLLQEFTADSDKAGGKVDVQLTPSLSLFGAVRLPQSHDRRSAEHPAAVRRRRQRAHLRAQPAVRPRRRRGRRQGDRCSKCGSDTRGRRRARIRRRSGPTARSTSSGSRVCRPTRASPAGCRRS